MSKDENGGMQPLADLGALTPDQFSNYCADLCEAVLSGEMNWDQAADLLFGPEPSNTYTQS